jgi:hypothetical protein
MDAKLEHVRAVYAKLVEDGFDASMKYPGYIAIDDLCSAKNPYTANL